MKLPTLAAETQQQYLSRAKRIHDVFGECPVEQVSVYHIQQFLDHHPISAAARHEVSFFSSALTFGARRGWLDSNPCQYVEKPVDMPRKRRVLAWEFEAVRSIASPQMTLVMELMHKI